MVVEFAARNQAPNLLHRFLDLLEIQQLNGSRKTDPTATSAHTGPPPKLIAAITAASEKRLLKKLCKRVVGEDKAITRRKKCMKAGESMNDYRAKVDG